MTATITFENGRYIFSADRELKLPGGFYRDGDGQYVTRSSQTANRLYQFCDHDARRELDRIYIRLFDKPAPPNVPKGYALHHVQRMGFDFCMQRNRSYLALDMGLGKTPVAVLAAERHQKPVVYILPPFLIENVKNEFRTWAPQLKVSVYGKKLPDFIKTDVMLVPMSLLTRPGILDTIRDFVRTWGEYDSLLIIDEAHFFKNWDAARSEALYGTSEGALKKRKDAGKLIIPRGLQSSFDRVIYMSGSPADNGILDLHTTLFNAAPETIQFMTRLKFAQYYCGAYRGQFGWTLNGKSPPDRVRELRSKVIAPTGKFMYRILKKDSGIKFPPKIEELLMVSGKMSPRLKSIDDTLGKRYKSDDDLVKKLLAAKSGGDDLHVAEYRRLLGIDKVPFLVKYVDALLTETNESIILFGFHREVIEALALQLAKWKPFVIMGGTKIPDRQRQVNEFQKKIRRLFLGNYQSMGVGLNMTAADRVIFGEYSWNPSVNGQAVDRAHRLGRDETVLVQYVVFQDSLDKRVVESFTDKRESIAILEKGA